MKCIEIRVMLDICHSGADNISFFFCRGSGDGALTLAQAHENSDE